jgi:hypothetical protein
MSLAYRCTEIEADALYNVVAVDFIIIVINSMKQFSS